MPETYGSPPLPNRTVELVVEYAGAGFAGWQVQPDCRTGQGELERALRELTGEAIRIVSASRTDAGVHALGQVCSFTTASTLEPVRLRRALNALLPDDLAVRSARDAAAGFHARFAAVGKRYRYRILARPQRSPHERGRAWHVPQPLDLEAMRAAARHLEGTHDFRSLVSRPDGDGDCTRTLFAVRVAPEAHGSSVLAIDVVGDGFLYKMVRTIAGTLAWAGRGKLSPDAVPALLAAGERRRVGPTAPPEGLFLLRVFYSRDQLEASLGELEGVVGEDHGYRAGHRSPGRHAGLRATEGEEARALR